MLQNFAQDTTQLDCPVVGWVLFFAFFVNWETFASFQMSGIFPVSIDLWKISCRMGANSLCNV